MDWWIGSLALLKREDNNVYLDPTIQCFFPDKQLAFDQLMALRGECFRDVKGRLTQRVSLGDKTYFIKQHRGVGWIEILKNLLQGRAPVLSAKLEWQAIKKCQGLGIEVPKIVAYGRRGCNPARMQSFILMEELAPVISLEDLGKTWLKTPPSFTEKRQLIESVARIARILHHNGINHRDFYICHFLLSQRTGSHSLYLIDLHRAQIRCLTPRRWIIKDLSGLYFSSKDIGLTQRDLYRFMKVYSGQTLGETLKSDRINWKKVRARGERLYSNHT